MSILWISCFKFSKVLIVFTIIIIILLCCTSGYFLFFKTNQPNSALPLEDNNLISFNETISSLKVENSTNENISSNEVTTDTTGEKTQSHSSEENDATETKSYIKWFEFKPTYDVLLKTSQLDINSHVKDAEVKYNWIELISYLACKYGNNFKKFKQSDLDSLVSKLKNGETMETLTQNMKLYSYYYEGYEAVLSQFIGEYQIQKPVAKSSSNNTSNSSTANSTVNTVTNNNATSDELPFTTVYGLKAFHPLAQNYSYSHYDDFGNSRSYGYKRLHFGNDLMGSIGTPVIAVESGIVEAVRLESIWWLASWHS